MSEQSESQGALGSAENGSDGTVGLRRLFVLALATVVLSYVAVTLLFVIAQRWLLFPAYAPDPRPDAADEVEGLEKIWIDSPEGPVESWFIPARGSSADNPAPLIVFAHGNGELIDWWPHDMAPYRELGFSVLLPEYRGYGRSAGDPSQDAIVDDFVAFYDTVTARPDVDGERVVYHGRSLGGGVLCALGRQRAPEALILESTFTSVPDLAYDRWLPGFLALDPFDNADALSDYDGPVLIVHGRDDDVVPLEHARALEEVASDATLWVRNCGHNDCPRGLEYWERIGRHVDPLRH